MARRNPIPQREIEICRRVREARQGTSLSQVAFARLVGIDSSQLASHEHARVPVRAAVALAVAQVSGVSIKWLATGIEPKNFPTPIDKKLRDRIRGKQLFSEAYDVVLMPVIEQALAEIKEISDGKFTPILIGSIGPDEVLSLIDKRLRKLVWDTPPHLYQELFSLLYWDMWNFRHNYASQIENFSGAAPAQKGIDGKIEYEGLTNVALSSNNSDVKAQLPGLLKRLNKATSERGTKAALAKFMGVKLPVVSRWLSGKKEPGGENTLRLLHWVEQRERQK